MGSPRGEAVISVEILWRASGLLDGVRNKEGYG